MDDEWVKLLLAAIGGGGVVGLVTQLWIFRAQLGEERRERARARMQELALRPEFIELLAAIARMTTLIGREVTKDEFNDAIKAYKKTINEPMNYAITFFLPDVIKIRLSKVWDLLEAVDMKGTQVELAKLSDDFKEILGLDVLE